MLFFGKKALRMKLSNHTSWSAVLCFFRNKPLDSKTHINRLFTILSIVLHKQLAKAMGLYLFGSEEFLLGFGIATMVAFLQEGRKILDSQMELKIVSSRVNKLSRRLVRSL